MDFRVFWRGWHEKIGSLGSPLWVQPKKTLGYHFSCIFRKSQDIIFHAFLGRVNEYGTHSQVHNIYQTNPSSFIKNLSRHFMSQHCQPISNHHREQPQERNRKINSEKVSGQLSSIQLVYPLYSSTEYGGP